jgi:hypothetical protein
VFRRRISPNAGRKAVGLIEKETPALIPLKKIFFAADKNYRSKFQSGSKNTQDILAGSLVISVSIILMKHMNNFCETCPQGILLYMKR